MQELLPGVLIWPWFSEPHGYDFNGTLVLHEEGNLCIDPVDPTEAVLDRLAKEGVAQILITNRNHTRAANRVRERTGGAVSIHPADAGYARNQGTSIDVDLGIGQHVGPFTIVGVPGKSPVESRKAIVLRPGFHAELVAAEPQIRKPINLAFDDRGRLLL